MIEIGVLIYLLGVLLTAEVFIPAFIEMNRYEDWAFIAMSSFIFIVMLLSWPILAFLFLFHWLFSRDVKEGDKD